MIDRDDPTQFDGLGRRVDWHHLVTDASVDEVARYFVSFDSYTRPLALTYFMLVASPRRCLQAFLDYGNMCDAPWMYRSHLAKALRGALTEVPLIEMLGPVEQLFCAGLPDLVPVWRGCERGRERGISWTIDRAIAEGFARGKRCINKYPTLASAQIPKAHVFGIFLDRKESEIAVDPRRLRGLELTNLAFPVSGGE